MEEYGIRGVTSTPIGKRGVEIRVLGYGHFLFR
jgi:hypothetical protein